MTAKTVLKLEETTKVFGEGPGRVVAVDGVDLEAREGELLLIMGPSGSGKTTLLTMAGGLLHPTSGRVGINGKDIYALPEGELNRIRQREVGFVFQSFNLLSSLTAQENVEVPLNMAGKGGREAREQARSLLLRFGLEKRLSFRPADLSGGEKQRVSVARALANNPRLVLADEPTANLDSQKGREIVELLRGIAREEGRTVIVVSHDHRIQELADRVLWLEDGKLKEIEVCRDPVCRMEIDPVRAPATLEYGGNTYYFCAEGCERLFREDPERFLGAGKQQPKG